LQYFDKQLQIPDKGDYGWVVKILILPPKFFKLVIFSSYFVFIVRNFLTGTTFLMD